MFLKHLDRSRFEPFLLVPTKGELTDKLVRLEIPCLTAEMQHWIATRANKKEWHPWRWLLGIPVRVVRIIRIIKQYDIDLVYTNTSLPADAAIATCLSKKFHIWHLREILVNNNHFRAYIPVAIVLRLIDKLSDRILVTSRALLIGTGLLNADIIYNGVDLSKFDTPPNAAAPDIRAQLNIPQSQKIVLNVDGLRPGKAGWLFVEAAARLAPEVPDVHFLIVGSSLSINAREIRQLCRLRGLEKRISILGWRSDLNQIISSINVLAVTSDFESFSRVVIEAMAASKPVVATRCGGPEEIVVDGQTGYLVPKGEPDDFGRALRKLLEDSDHAKRMGARGRELAEEKFSEARYVSTLQQVLNDCCRHIHDAG